MLSKKYENYKNWDTKSLIDLKNLCSNKLYDECQRYDGDIDTMFYRYYKKKQDNVNKELEKRGVEL